MPCEDAPCCGCCGTNIYGVNQELDSDMTKEDYLEMMMSEDYDPDLQDEG
jgi:hypothetical protein